MRSRPSMQAGFTLAETMVALFILAIVSTAGSALLISATSASQQIRQQEAEARRLDVAQSLIRQDIAAMSLRAVKPADGFSPSANLIGEAPRGELPFLRFVRTGWLNPGSVEPRSNLQYVQYILRSGALIREATLRPDAISATPVSSRVLLEDVASIELGFFRGDQRSEFWQGDALQGLDLMPSMIEMDIIFTDGTRLSLATLTGARP
ncbi:MAG: type II secretion system minor pseudopilin GspJ [Pseudomonadota bacterium]